jgi:hypothetical protein
MWRLFTAHHAGERTIDYSVAGTLVSSPVWAPYLADFNVLLTTLGLVLGVLVGAVRLYKDVKRKD